VRPFQASVPPLHSGRYRAGNHYCVVTHHNRSTTRGQDVTLHWSVTCRYIRLDFLVTHLLSATIPTVGNVVEALSGICDEITETLKQMAAISAELDARDHIQVEDIRQVG